MTLKLEDLPPISRSVERPQGALGLQDLPSLSDRQKAKIKEETPSKLESGAAAAVQGVTAGWADEGLAALAALEDIIHIRS